MQYRKDKGGQELSVLGYGCMRFTRKGGGIDVARAEREILAAVQGDGDWNDKLRRLVGIALENGGPDNITAMFAVAEEAGGR